ncbi:hypothetical protein DAPPUDRAFT_119700, partial [Daphnia pulex]
AALSALTQFTICIGKQSYGEQACLAALSILIPKLSEAIQTDWRFEVVREALDCLTELLEELKGLVIKSKDHLDTVCMSMRMVFYKLTACQMMERAEEGDEEENDVEGFDSEACVDLLDYAGGVLAAFGSAMTPQRGSIARLRKSLSVPASCRCAWNRWMPFWNRWYRFSTRLLPT